MDMASVHQPAGSYVHQLCSDTGYHQEDQQSTMTDRNKLQKRDKGTDVGCIFDDDDNDDGFRWLLKNKLSVQLYDFKDKSIIELCIYNITGYGHPLGWLVGWLDFMVYQPL